MDSKFTKYKINEKVFRRLMHRVYLAERENFKTQKRKPTVMNEFIRKIIEFEVDKDAD